MRAYYRGKMSPTILIHGEEEYTGEDKAVTINLHEVLENSDIVDVIDFYTEGEILKNIEISEAIKEYGCKEVLLNISVQDRLDSLKTLDIINEMGEDILEHFSDEDLLNFLTKDYEYTDLEKKNIIKILESKFDMVELTELYLETLRNK